MFTFECRKWCKYKVLDLCITYLAVSACAIPILVCRALSLSLVYHWFIKWALTKCNPDHHTMA